MPRRSLRIAGKSTSIHLEDAFWRQIDQLSEESGVSWSEYCRQIVDNTRDVPNRSAAVKQRLLELAQTSVPKEAIAGWRITDGEASTDIRFAQPVITIGRSSQCDIRIRSSRASRVHAVLLRINTQWWVVDLKSHNGTKVSGRRITRSALRSNQIIQIAGVSIERLRPGSAGKKENQR